jgi:hypothetical protein
VHSSAVQVGLQPKTLCLAVQKTCSGEFADRSFPDANRRLLFRMDAQLSADRERPLVRGQPYRFGRGDRPAVFHQAER